MRQAMRGGGGGFQIAGRFTRLGRMIAGYYFVVFVVGLVVTHQLGLPHIIDMLLYSDQRFELWQLASHILVYYPSGVINFLIYLLIFWIFAWQIELDLGREHFLFLVFGVPLLAGAVGLFVSWLGPTQGPLAGFALVIDSLVVAFGLTYRNSTINAYFIFPIKAIYFVYFMLGMQTLRYLAGENPIFFYELAAMGITALSLGRGGWRNIGLWRDRWKAWRLRRKYSKFRIVDNGGDEDDGGPVYHNDSSPFCTGHDLRPYASLA